MEAQPACLRCDDVIEVLSGDGARKVGANPGLKYNSQQRLHQVRADPADRLNTDITDSLIVLCCVCSALFQVCNCMAVSAGAPDVGDGSSAVPTEGCLFARQESAMCVPSGTSEDFVTCDHCLNKCCVNCKHKLYRDETGEQIGDVTGHPTVRPEAASNKGMDEVVANEGKAEAVSGYSDIYKYSNSFIAGRDLEVGQCKDHPALSKGNDDWLRIIGPSANRVDSEGLFCTLWAVDIQLHGVVELEVDIFENCLLATCACKFSIEGAVSQLRPCRVFAECMCRGDTDPDWDYILRGACFGFKVIDDDCDSSYTCGNYTSITKEPVGQVMTTRLREELAEGLLTTTIEKCICTHALGSVPKGEGDFRAIVDCSSPMGECVNDHTWSCRNKFSYNSVDMVAGMLQKDDVLATVDISNAYRAVNIHPDSRERQGLAWDFGEGTVFMRDNRLCMGLSSSPYVFSKISDFVVRCLVREGFTECVNYLDDFCLVGRDKASCGEAQMMLVAILRRIGFYVSYKKLTPAKTVTRFLGIEIDSVKLELRLPQDKLDKLHNQLQIFIRRRKASKLELEGLGGILAHCCKVVRGGRTFSRRVYDLISSVRRNHHKVRLNEDFRLDLEWWLKFAAIFNGKARIIPPGMPAVSVYSDASLAGFGATHGDDWLAGVFGEHTGLDTGWLGHHLAASKDTGCNTNNINVLEMWPILEGVRRWSKNWSDTPVVFVTDNTQVQAALNSGRSKNKTTMGWLRLIFWESVKYNFDVTSVYINTKNNTICDSLSRLTSFKNIARIRDADVADKMCCHHIFKC